MRNISVYKIARWLVFCLVIYFPLFLHLDYLPIHLWDEARLAVSAFEMTENFNFIVTYFEGEADLWNTKPPLMIWLQAAFMKLIGYNELAVRLPAALASLFTCFVIVWASKKITGHVLLGILAVLMLVCSSGFVRQHISRSGDYDAVLVFFTTLYTISLYIYLEASISRKRYLLIFFIALICAVLTKGVAGLLFLPGIVIYVLIKNKWAIFFKEKYFYVGVIAFVVLILGYYFFRESYNPGYIDAVIYNELGGRYLKTIEMHKHPFNFYFEHIINHDFKYWYLFIPAGIITGLLVKNYAINNLTLYATICALTFLLIISYSDTKLFWYSAPAIPLLAILTAVFFVNLFNAILSFEFVNQYSEKRIVALLPFILLFITPYTLKVNSIYFEKIPQESLVPYELPYYLKHKLKTGKNITGLKILYGDYHASINFYQKVFRTKNQPIQFYPGYNADNYVPGDKIAVSQDFLKHWLENDFEVDILEKYRTVSVYQIKARITAN